MVFSSVAAGFCVTHDTFHRRRASALWFRFLWHCGKGIGLAQVAAGQNFRKGHQSCRQHSGNPEKEDHHSPRKASGGNKNASWGDLWGHAARGNRKCGGGEWGCRMLRWGRLLDSGLVIELLVLRLGLWMELHSRSPCMVTGSVASQVVSQQSVLVPSFSKRVLRGTRKWESSVRYQDPSLETYCLMRGAHWGQARA